MKELLKNKRLISLSIVIVIAIFSWWMKNRDTVGSASTNSGEVVASSGEFVAAVNEGNPDIHIALGIPTSANATNTYLLKRAQYVLSYNPSTKNPDWVSWNLSAWWYGDAERFKGQFIPDNELPRSLGERTTHRDYTGSGFDRGHMVRSEERTRNDEDNRSTFYTTNLLPQYHELNAGPWLRLEEFCEYLCKRKNKELYVISGPIYSSDMGEIGKGVRVPSECFKIVVMLDKGQGLKDITQNTRIITVRMPNSRDIQGTQWRSYETTIRAIEQATGYDFLSSVPKQIQDILETKVSNPAES
ncbi:MAG: DNA/RNA non-specific endonuclease [Candidatus Kapabacteria bacterium]|nr:DNA/RNA non-specific endonuclease [Candidatus Kapabacteria bacterium]